MSAYVQVLDKSGKKFELQFQAQKGCFAPAKSQPVNPLKRPIYNSTAVSTKYLCTALLLIKILLFHVLFVLYL